MVDFGNRLKTLRLQKRLTQEDLALQLGMTKSVISAYETGLRRPSYETLILLSKIFKVSTDYLLGVAPNNRTNVDLSGLSDTQISAVLTIISSMK